MQTRPKGIWVDILSSIHLQVYDILFNYKKTVGIIQDYSYHLTQ